MRIRYQLPYGLAACACALPLVGYAQAQDGEGVQETVIVTGSHIRRGTFDGASPIVTIDPELILTSGQATIGGLIRDLPYTQNVDTVANVLGVQDGQQDSNSSRFNLRGLGTSSTLTLMDGRRAIDPGAIATILPELAIGSIDIVLDGGAATYGTDAIAGVVNFVPRQSYDGVQVRAFYTQDSDGKIPEPKISALWGTGGERFDVVAALDYSKRDDALYRSDRPKYLRADNDTSVFSNPGQYGSYRPGNTTAGIFPFRRDPDCGQFNGSNTDDGLAGSYPSGAPNSFYCTWEYGEFQDFKRPNENLVTYVSGTLEVSDNVTLKGMLNYSDRISRLISSPTTGDSGTNNVLLIPAGHPNNPFGVNLSPYSSFWRPFTGKMGSTQPSNLDSRGADNTEFNYTTQQISLGTEFEFGNSWYGEFWVVDGSVTTNITGYWLNSDKLQQALRGEGGVGGNQWFNPFGSASTLSPNYVAGETGTGGTANAQSLVDWLFDSGSYDSRKEEYWSVEGFVSGEIAQMPAGPLSLAVGAQVRNRDLTTNPSILSRVASVEFPDLSALGGPANQNYNSSPTEGVGTSTYGESGVNAVFAELDVPLAETLSMIIAARYEDFTDFNMKKTVPKVSLRYQPTDNLALRTSWGEGFLAPTITEITVQPTPSCVEIFSGSDPFGFSKVGALSCGNGNPNLKPETSEVKNIGFSWRATDGIEFSADYQRIQYDDRIVGLVSDDILNADYARFLAVNPTYESADAATQETMRRAWYASGQDPAITRDPVTELLTLVNRYSDNVNYVEADVLDLRLTYTRDLASGGLFTTSLATTYYPSYKYLDYETGGLVDAAGKQNGDTNIAPPMPEFKTALRFGWLHNKHSLAMTVHNHSGIIFDATPGPSIGPNAVTEADIPDKIDGYTTVDMRYAYSFDDVGGGAIDVAIGAINLTDNDAQPLPVVGGLETRLQDPTGRMLYLEGTFRFE